MLVSVLGEVEFWELQLSVTLLGNPLLVEEVQVNYYLVKSKLHNLNFVRI